jgi:dTMP kinase
LEEVLEKLVFIVIDGLDASGKSTQTCLLQDSLLGMGKSVLVRIHPSSDNFFGIETTRFLHLSGTSAHFAASVFYMIDVIRSILLFCWQKYDFVIFVRYLMGTAYLPSPLDIVGYLFFFFLVPKSNYMFFLDVHAEEAYRRIALFRHEREIFENLEMLRKIRIKAIKLALTGGWRIIDAERPADEVGSAILKLAIS